MGHALMGQSPQPGGGRRGHLQNREELPHQRFTEIIAYTLRVFAPVDRAGVVEAVLRRHAVMQVLEAGA